MILIDTSVWIDFFKGRDTSIINRMTRLLDDDEVGLAVPVWIELLSGASRAEAPRLSKILSALPRFYPRRDTWKLIEIWIKKAAGKGYRFAMADLLIAAIASENDAVLWSLDSDFSQMATLRFLRVM